MRTPEKSITNNSIARAVALGQERDAIEQRYERARAEFIESSQELRRYRELYAQIVATIPDSIDLTGDQDAHREPIMPMLVTAGELDSEAGR